jgi:hypothetical protein
MASILPAGTCGVKDGMETALGQVIESRVPSMRADWQWLVPLGD